MTTDIQEFSNIVYSPGTSLYISLFRTSVQNNSKKEMGTRNSVTVIQTEIRKSSP